MQYGAYDKAKKAQEAREKRAKSKAAMSDEERVKALVAAGLSEKAAEAALRAAPEEEPTVG